MAKLEGTIVVSGLPPHRGLIVNLCFYRVDTADAPAPYGGDPPADAVADSHDVFAQVDLHTESDRTAYELPFAIERQPGLDYLQVRAILFRAQAGKVFAQAERFFFDQRPVRVPPRDGALALPVTWPTQSLEELHHQGTVRPQQHKPWWRLW